MTNPAHETALAAAVVAVARSMGADADTIRRLRDAAKGKEPPETFLSTKQVCERLGLCQKSVLDMAEELGTIGYEIVCDISARVTRVYVA